MYETQCLLCIYMSMCNLLVNLCTSMFTTCVQVCTSKHALVCTDAWHACMFIGYWRTSLYYTAPGPCRANVLSSKQTQPRWWSCTLQTLQSILFLAHGSEQGLQTGMKVFRERLDSHHNHKALMQAGVVGRHQGPCELSQVIVF